MDVTREMWYFKKTNSNWQTNSYKGGIYSGLLNTSERKEKRRILQTVCRRRMWSNHTPRNYAYVDWKLDVGSSWPRDNDGLIIPNDLCWLLTVISMMESCALRGVMSVLFALCFREYCSRFCFASSQKLPGLCVPRVSYIFALSTGALCCDFDALLSSAGLISSNVSTLRILKRSL